MAPISSATRSTPTPAPRLASTPAPRATPTAPAHTGHSTADVFESSTGQAGRTTAPLGPVTESTRITPGGRETWQGSDILRNLGQLDGTSDAHAASRCTASSTLATAIVSGAPSTDRYVLRLYEANSGHPETQRELTGIYNRLGSGTSTYGDMHRLQELTYTTFERDGVAGTSPIEAAAMRSTLSLGMRADAPTSAIAGRRELHAGGTAETPEHTRARVDSLRRGESFMLNVDNDDVRHAITVGRDRDGRTYLYDSAPPAGTPNFSYEAENPERFARTLDGTRGTGDLNLVINGATQRDW